MGKKYVVVPLANFIHFFLTINSGTDGEMTDLVLALIEFFTGWDMGPYTIRVSVRQAIDYVAENPGEAIGRATGSAVAVGLARLIAGAVGMPKYMTFGKVRIQMR